MKPLAKQALVALAVIVVIGGLFSRYQLAAPKADEITMGTLVELIQAQAVKRVEVRGTELRVIRSDDSIAVSQKEQDQSLPELLATYGVSAEELKRTNIHIIDNETDSYFWRILIPSLLPLVLLVGIFWFMARQMQGANNRAISFGQVNAKEADNNPKNRMTFADVAGAKEAKEELSEVVEFLKNPKKFADVGAKLPKGVLLMGRPGTGKTLLARAVAGEAEVPFFHMSGSEFVEMFVGVGASRVRDLFTRAKKSAPCIVFIDEIDAVGRQRGAGLGGSHDEREQTLNQILVEMDGFDPHIGVIVMAATNRPDVLDPALLRPGRFDRRVVIDLPDLKDREDILRVHAKNKPTASDVDLKRVAERTIGFAGADLSNLMNEAAIRTARRNQKEVTQIDILESIEKVLLGPERRSHLLSDEEKRVTAYHEAGHALVAHFLPFADPVHKVSIISRGSAGGYTLKLPNKDRKMQRKSEFLDDLCVLLGGFMTEQLVFGDITTGASDDLKRSTRLAREMVVRFGMSEALGPRVFGETQEMVFLGRDLHEQRNYSEKTAELIDSEIDRFVREAQKRTLTLLEEQRTYLDKIADVLIKQETIEKEAFEALFANVPVPPKQL